MILCFIIENDKIVFGFMRDGTLIASASLSAVVGRTEDEYAVMLREILSLHGISAGDFCGAICASVLPSLTETVRGAVFRLLGFRAHLIGSGIRTGLKIGTENPTELGGDLVASAVGATHLYPGEPLILVSVGTAITFSAIDKGGVFLGCAIAPGYRLASGALCASAGLLPQVTNTVPKATIGKNTAESLQSGTLFGTAAMIDGMLDRMEAEMGVSARVLVTGSESSTVLPLCRHTAEERAELALLGLSLIYERNESKRKAK